LEILGAELPSMSLGIGSSLASINWIIILTVFVSFLFLAIIIFLFLDYRKFNKKIVLFENIGGKGYQVVLKDRARLIKVGDGGEELLYLKKSKAYRTAYGKKMAKNTFWFAKGQDGYWYNIELGDLDAKMGMLDIEPIDRDMRYMHVAIRKNISDRYKKINFMEKYGTIMMNGVFLLIMIGGIWIIVSKMGDVMDSINLGIETAKVVNQNSANVLSTMDNICSGGSGLIPA